MTHIHKLSTAKHFDFLNQQRKDPITGDLIKENDEVVICSSCKSAFLKESWDYLGEEHCNQSQTLATIPKQSALALKSGLITSLKLTPIEDVLTKFLFVLFVEIILFISFFFIIRGSLIILLILAAIVILVPIAIGVLITPIIRVDLYSSHLLIKNIIGHTIIDYHTIQHITLQCYESEQISSRIQIKYTNRGTYDIPLKKSLIDTSIKEELLDFIAILSRYATITMKVRPHHQQEVARKKLEVTIKVV